MKWAALVVGALGMVVAAYYALVWWREESYEAWPLDPWSEPNLPLPI